MKTRKNVKGFTLVELIVVIAIIGVLAAILVPSMLGYVKKSKISAANSNAKSMFNACATALTEVDSEGGTFPDFDKAITYAGTTDFDKKIQKYFDGIKAYTGGTKWAAYELSDGAVKGVAMYDGLYCGTNPKATTADNATTLTAVDDAITYAMS